MTIQVKDASPFETRVTINNRKCLVCGVKFRRNMKNLHIPDNNACDTCRFWYSHWQDKDSAEVARINGNHYRLNPGSSFNMGGAKVRIHFNDGRVVESDGLSHQGEIPHNWVEYGLTDNATFGEII